MFMARSRAPVSAAAWRTRSRRGWRSAVRTAPMTWTPRSLREGAGSFGDFDTHTVQGGNDRIARALAGEPRRRRAAVGARAGGQLVGARGARRHRRGRGGGRRGGGGRARERDRRDPVRSTAAGRPRSLLTATCATETRRSCSSPLRTPAPPSATLSVPGRFWCYTQLGADGEPLPFVAAFAGSSRAVDALDVHEGPDCWVRCAAPAAPRPRARARRGACVDLGPRSLGPRRVLGALGQAPIEDPELRRPVGPSDVRRRAHGRPLARPDGGRAAQRPAGRPGAADLAGGSSSVRTRLVVRPRRGA